MQLATTRDRNRRAWAAVTMASVVLALTGCAQANQDPAPDLARNAGSPSRSASPSVSSTPVKQGAAGAMGIDVVAWPGHLQPAKQLFRRMPDELLGARARHPGFYGPSAGVVYGRQDNESTAYVMGTDKRVKDPTAVLSFMFGMGFACKKDSYLGTAPQSRFGGGPDLDDGKKFDAKKGVWWFSCTIDGAEGNPQLTGYALGWVSGELGYLITSPNKQTAKSLVQAMVAAR
jgi:hypothetical protein